VNELISSTPWNTQGYGRNTSNKLFHPIHPEERKNGANKWGEEKKKRQKKKLFVSLKAAL
jgi:hypothetical protein